MARSVVGDVVVVRFPFSDLSGVKLRPALVVGQAEFGNLVLCQITSKPYASRRTIVLKAQDFSIGELPVTSYIRPDKLFTADPEIIQKTAGKLNPATRKKVLVQVRRLFRTV